MKALVPTPEVAAVALRRGENATLGKSQVDALLSAVATRLRDTAQA